MCRPERSTVKSPAPGVAAERSTRVKAIRRPPGENEGMASNGPVVSLRLQRGRDGQSPEPGSVGAHG